MSVLNQSGEEQVECPLCMEPLEVDDLNFYPCTCGYQICRFCWHRIRTDENGLCPACRKAYSEDPADFKPLSQEEVAKLKAEKRQRDQQRKAKMSENRKHLASVRVVQRNLVFVVGLPMRLADAEVLKKHEYFGKFGKIHKVVINQSTAYAGSQGPSASAYVTYFKNDDALRAIQSVNNITIDGRLIKSSLGTTKYCSHFMKNQVCPKTDCMYLHDFGDTDASFTKEQMHAGKHQEYEKKLHDALLQRAQTNSTSSASTTVVESRSPVNTTPIVTTVKSSKDILLVTAASTTLSSTANSTTNNTTTTTQMNNNGTNKENWPQLNVEKEKKDKDKAGKKVKTKVLIAEKKDKLICNGKNHDKLIKYETINRDESVTPPSLDADAALLVEALLPISSTVSKLAPIIDDNSSFFSLNSFQKISPEHQSDDDPAILSESSQSTSILTDALPNINTSEDWEAAFGFTDHSTEHLLELKQQQQQQQAQRDNVNGFVHHDSGFVNKGTNNYNGYYEKIHENIADVLNNKSNGFHFKQDNQQQQQQQQILNGMNGLDQNMSKFFMDFHKNNKELQLQQQQQSASYRNSYNCYSAVQSHTDRMLLLHQKQLEEQLMNISLNKNYGGGGAISPSASYHHTNGSASHQQQHYMNGEQHQYGVGGVKSANSRMAEDELDFDPFQETQKAFAELMANEQHQNHHNKLHNTVRSNGVIHSQAGHLPPPPPGFLQPTATHMNSFGSKILPFLNMSNNSQQINSSTQNNWPSSYNAQMQQHKNLNNTCNDWKVLDPAILSSSKYCPIREPFSQPQQHSGLPYATTATTSSTQHQQQQQQQIGGPLRSSAYDYTNNSFSNFTQQLQQPNFSNFSQLNSQSNLNWYTSEINSQISSPPGFRNSQTTKQQEC